MKTALIILLALASFTASSQAKFNTKRIFVVFQKDGNPVKAYSNAIDYYTFINNKPFWTQDVNLYFPVDSVMWSPGTKNAIDDVYYPVELPEKYLSKTRLLAVMQKENNLVDRVFTDSIKGRQYAIFRKARTFYLPYFYRDSIGYKEVLKLRKQMYN